MSMNVKVTIPEESLASAQKLLAGIPGGSEKAVASAMRRVLEHIRTNSSQEIRKRYAISNSSLRMHENIKMHISNAPPMSASITFSGNRIPLFRFEGASPAYPAVDKSRLIRAIISGEWKKMHPGVTAKGHALKSTSPKTLHNTFVAKMESGHTGIFERTGGKTHTGNDALQEIKGPAVAQMIGNQEVAQRITDQSMEKFEQRLEHEIARILNGWGG